MEARKRFWFKLRLLWLGVDDFFRTATGTIVGIWLFVGVMFLVETIGVWIHEVPSSHLMPILASGAASIVTIDVLRRDWW